MPTATGRFVFRRAALAIAGVLAACATASAPTAPRPGPDPALAPIARALGFALDAPGAGSLGAAIDLWATHYYTPAVTPAPETISAAIPLLGRAGAPISPPLRVRDWCEAALQGSVSVSGAEGPAAYAFIDSNGPEQANCDAWLGDLSDRIKRATRRARFVRVSHPLGCGVRNIPLMPFRTIAVDPATIPFESAIYVPALRGRAFRHNRRDWVHDGYLFAGDRGGAIRDAHIDVFHGEAADTPFEDIFASTPAITFPAHILAPDHPAAQALAGAHGHVCAAQVDEA